MCGSVIETTMGAGSGVLGGVGAGEAVLMPRLEADGAKVARR